jgi:hypothetical protein
VKVTLKGELSTWGLIKIQDNHCSEANYANTKFCSDPKCVLPGANKNAKISTPANEVRVFNYNADQGERWERVVCKLQQRRGAYRVSLLSPTCVLRKFAGDMSHCPSKLIKATKALLRVPKSLRATTNCIDHELLKTADQQTISYK